MPNGRKRKRSSLRGSRRPSVKRRRRRRKRIVRKSYRRGRLRVARTRRIRSALGGFPTKYRTLLTYTAFKSPAGIAGGDSNELGHLHFSVNNINHPDLNDPGHQPMGLDSFRGIYKKYLVTKSTFSVQAMSKVGGVNVGGLINTEFSPKRYKDGNVEGTATPSNRWKMWREYIENGGSYKIVDGYGGGKNRVSFPTRVYKPHFLEGVDRGSNYFDNDAINAPLGTSTSSATGPSVGGFFNILFGPPDSDTGTMAALTFKITIKYWVTFNDTEIEMDLDSTVGSNAVPVMENGVLGTESDFTVGVDDDNLNYDVARDGSIVEL